LHHFSKFTSLSFISFHSFLKLEESIFLIKLLRHIGIWVMLIEKLNGMESAAIDVEVYVAAVGV